MNYRNRNPTGTGLIVDQRHLVRSIAHTHKHTYTTILWPFFRDHPGEPVPEENFWTLWCKGRFTEADTLTIQLGATPSGLTSAYLRQPPHMFYRPDALPATQPTVSKNWRQLAHSDKGEDARVLLNDVTCTVSVPCIVNIFIHCNLVITLTMGAKRKGHYNEMSVITK